MTYGMASIRVKVTRPERGYRGRVKCGRVASEVTNSKGKVRGETRSVL